MSGVRLEVRRYITTFAPFKPSNEGNKYVMKLPITNLLAGVLLSGSCLAQADLKPTLVYPGDYFPTGNHTFDVLVQNVGNATVPWNGFKIGWQVNNGTISEVLPATPTYGLGANSPVTRSTGNFSASFPSPGTYKLKVWTRTLTVTDANHANDTFVKTVEVLPYVPPKNVLMEVFKHQACCPCIEAACYEDSVVSQKANYAIANIYTVKSDVLYNAEGRVPDSVWAFGHPAILFDRFIFPHRTSVQRPVSTVNNIDVVNDMHERERYFSPLRVSFHASSFNTTTRELKVKLKARVYDTLSGDLRFNLYLTEDSIVAWQGCATPDPNNYIHRHVVRKMCGGGWGQSGSLPATLYPGQDYLYEFVYTVPTAYKTNRIELIGLVQQYHNDLGKRFVLNSEKIGFNQSLTLSAGKPVAADDISVYPNPVTDQVFITNSNGKTLTINLLTIDGKELRRTTVTTKSTLDMSNLPTGSYLLRIADEQSVIKTTTLIKQ